MRRTKGWIFGTGLLLFAAAVGLRWRDPRPSTSPDVSASPPAAASPTPTSLARAEPSSSPRSADSKPAPVTAPRGPEHPVNLERLRELIPENGYWTRHAPTDDPEELERRRLDERSWNVLFGKVQAGEATLEELEAWFEHRRRTSEDAIAFARQVLETFGDDLPERERGLYELAIRMHTTRLEELPRARERALERRRLQSERRKAWSTEQR